MLVHALSCTKYIFFIASAHLSRTNSSSVCFVLCFDELYLFCPCPFYPVVSTGRGAPENTVMEFEAKSGRDGAWLVTLSIM